MEYIMQCCKVTYVAMLQYVNKYCKVYFTQCRGSWAQIHVHK